MQALLDLFHNLTDAKWIMAHGGLYIVVFIVFAETGLFAGFFLPGDSLLFIAGMIIAQSVSPDVAPALSLLYWVTLISASAIIGNYVGYWFGKKSGEVLMKRKDSWLFKKKYLIQAKDFYEKKGGGAIMIARFLPVVRTFAPIVAGMVNMDRKKFTLYNILGAVAWAGSIVTAGFLLGNYDWVKNNLDKIIIGIVVVTTAPVLIKMIASRKKKEPLPADQLNS
ncbi:MULTISPECIES: DedA family protein [Chitinophagaceae]|uniref:Membrane-associated protein n=1 Tax=Pseudobacter ginsenosidimutans TaxID=661488 RepID=A0A4Q7MEP2_9BACT|nr:MULTISPECIES: VTT domain-containing protein [Chitinophagaceae]QEC45231.1 DedA family protein [Pseudobacter ginsenosidimutans]RZS65498.1 membrane-associated protein [Pseudobacter ginsenosidimutans]